MNAKEWYYSKYATGSNDDNGVLDGWFQRMEEYANLREIDRIKEIENCLRLVKSATNRDMPSFQYMIDKLETEIK